MGRIKADQIYYYSRLVFFLQRLDLHRHRRNRRRHLGLYRSCW